MPDGTPNHALSSRNSNNQGLNFSKFIFALKSIFNSSLREVYAIYDEFGNIDFDTLRKEGTRGIILDVDGTIAPHLEAIPENNIAKIKELCKMGFRVIIHSNMGRTWTGHGNENRYSGIYGTNNFQVLYSDYPKPMKQGFKQCLEVLGLEAKEVVMIGDNLFTDGGCIKIDIKLILLNPISSPGEGFAHNFVKNQANKLAVLTTRQVEQIPKLTRETSEVVGSLLPDSSTGGFIPSSRNNNGTLMTRPRALAICEALSMRPSNSLQESKTEEQGSLREYRPRALAICEALSMRPSNSLQESKTEEKTCDSPQEPEIEEVDSLSGFNEDLKQLDVIDLAKEVSMRQPQQSQGSNSRRRSTTLPCAVTHDTSKSRAMTCTTMTIQQAKKLAENLRRSNIVIEDEDIVIEK